MKKYVKDIRSYIHTQLANAAREYLRIGMKLFHEQHERDNPFLQPVVGNLAVAVELMLKACIAHKNISLLFKGLPTELAALFSAVECLPKGFNYRPFDVKLRSFDFQSVQLDDAIGVFYVLYPSMKQLYQPYFKFLRSVRNRSLHAALPKFQNYDTERIAYLALKLSQDLKEQDVLGFYKYYATKDDEEFLKQYDENRVKRVDKKIRKAKEESESLEPGDIEIEIEEFWMEYRIPCPVCQSTAIVYGDTTEGAEQTGSYDWDPTLTFYADSFVCSECGLELADVEELKLAGFDIRYDRGEDYDQWVEDNMDHWEEDY